MTGRGRIICLAIGVVLTVLIEVLTANVINYNLFLLILSAFGYFVNLMFVILDIYCVITTKFTKYHSCAAARDGTILGMQLAVYYILGNLRTIKLVHLLIAVLIVAVLIYIARKITMLMNRICPYVYSG